MAREITLTLAHGGVAVIEVPYDLLEMGFLFHGAEVVPELQPEHLNFYSSSSLALLLAHAGLEVAEVRVGAQIHNYSGLISSITAVGRRTWAPPPPSDVAATPPAVGEVLRADRRRVRFEQQRLKALGVLARRGRW